MDIKKRKVYKRMIDGELLFLWIGFITGVTLSFFLIFLGDYTTHRDLQKRLKKDRG